MQIACLRELFGETNRNPKMKNANMLVRHNIRYVDSVQWNELFYNQSNINSFLFQKIFPNDVSYFFLTQGSIIGYIWLKFHLICSRIIFLYMCLGCLLWRKLDAIDQLPGVLHLGQKSLRKALAYVGNKIKRKKTCMQQFRICNLFKFNMTHIEPQIYLRFPP